MVFVIWFCSDLPSWKPAKNTSASSPSSLLMSRPPLAGSRRRRSRAGRKPSPGRVHGELLDCRRGARVRSGCWDIYVDTRTCTMHTNGSADSKPELSPQTSDRVVPSYARDVSSRTHPPSRGAAAPPPDRSSQPRTRGPRPRRGRNRRRGHDGVRVPPPPTIPTRPTSPLPPSLLYSTIELGAHRPLCSLDLAVSLG